MHSSLVRCAALLCVTSFVASCSSSASSSATPPTATANAATETERATTSEQTTPVASTAIEAKKELDMTKTQAADGFHALATQSLDGKAVSLSDYKGKVVLVVNTASECGLTPQYAGLETLHTQLSAKGFSVLAFPSNDFGGQEPGTPEQIQTFCSTKYGVTFPLFAKVQTKAGAAQSPIYAWLQTRTGQLPRWNFGKYLISKDGAEVQYFDSKIAPDDPALRAAIDGALAK